MLGKTSKRLNHDEIRERLKQFLINYTDPDMETEL